MSKETLTIEEALATTIILFKEMKKEKEEKIEELKKDLKFSLDSWDVQGFSHKGEMIRQKWGL